MIIRKIKTNSVDYIKKCFIVYWWITCVISNINFSNNKMA